MSTVMTGALLLTHSLTHSLTHYPCPPARIQVMKKNKRERDQDSVRHGDQYDTQLLWFLMRHMRHRRPQRVSARFIVARTRP